MHMAIRYDLPRVLDAGADSADRGRQCAGFSRASSIISPPNAVTCCLTRPALLSLSSHQVVLISLAITQVDNPWIASRVFTSIGELIK